MRVLQVISKNDRYGAQRIFLDQVASLRDLGHAVWVVGKGDNGYVADSVRALGVPYHGLAMKGPRDVLFLRRFIRDNRIEVVHSTLDRADYTALLAARLAGRPAVSTMMVPRVHPGFRFMNRITVLSRKQQRLLESRRIRPEKIRLIRPGIDLDRFSTPDPVRREAWRTRLAVGDRSIVFCHIASMLERKAHLVSMELVAECRRRGERPLLVVIGDPLSGDYYQSLRDFARKAGIEEDVVFTGWTAEVPEILSLSHFTILPSENEALGVVLMEGMAAGTPVIAREGEGGAELVEEYGAGFLYRPSAGIAQLAAQVLALYRDENRFRALSEECARTARDQFSLHRFGTRLADIYLEVIRVSEGDRS